MTVQEYISVFRMEQPNYEFNRIEFVKAFGQEFREDIEAIKESFESSGKRMPYNWFKDTVKAYRKKYNNISFTKKGPNLSEGLWSAFYSLHVIPVRQKLFPESEKRIQIRKEFRNIGQQDNVK